jgi:hypothetical protein
MRKVLLAVALVLFPMLTFAASVELEWDAVAGAAGYKIYVSNDLGVTWASVDVGNVTTRVMTGVLEDRIVLFKGSAYKTGGTEETIRNWSGAFYDHRRLPLLTPAKMRVP